MEMNSLKRLAWLQVTKTLQKNTILDKDILVELGVPKCFYEWIDGGNISAA